MRPRTSDNRSRSNCSMSSVSARAICVSPRGAPRGRGGRQRRGRWQLRQPPAAQQREQRAIGQAGDRAVNHGGRVPLVQEPARAEQLRQVPRAVARLAAFARRRIHEASRDVVANEARVHVVAQPTGVRRPAGRGEHCGQEGIRALAQFLQRPRGIAINDAGERGGVHGRENIITINVVNNEDWKAQKDCPEESSSQAGAIPSPAASFSPLDAAVTGSRKPAMRSGSSPRRRPSE